MEHTVVMEKKEIIPKKETIIEYSQTTTVKKKIIRKPGKPEKNKKIKAPPKKAKRGGKGKDLEDLEPDEEQ